MRASHCPWKGFLAQQVYEALTKDSAKAPPAPLESAATIVDLAADERRWNVTSDGLQVTFDRNEIASYFDGEYEVTIDWSTLKPYLAVPPPFPIPPP
ncbi:MAG: DUF3298 domain-containing protein [Hyphomicrobiales bacterium]|nr:DUF3298 domain-containing protein [Hyphomicrobiales bacterium]